MKKTKSILLILIILTIPTFLRMLRFGIYSMQDPHLFRFFEFDKCVQDFQIPCRWAPDSGFGYGEPLFNFYGQLSYAFGEIFHLVGLSITNSTKLLFIFSLLGSAVSMFLLSKKLWKNNFSAVLSALFYVYAPYRAVDIWVRGALPETLSFVLLPLIILTVEYIFEREKIKYFLWLSILFSALILTHNLSFIMFSPFILAWITYRAFLDNRWIVIPKIFVAFIFSLAISAFYILPVITESRFVTLSTTTQGYFDFRGHYATLYQLLFSRYWGYGASLFGPEDNLNLSVGLLQWLVPAIIIFIIFKKDLRKYKDFLVLVILGWFFLFLTHNKSTFIWEIIKPMAYIQFPWRFLSIALFCFALACGTAIKIFKNYKILVISLLCSLVILLNFSFFKEDIWYKSTDRDFLSSEWWEIQKTTSVGDYWPNFGGSIPTSLAPSEFQGQNLIGKTSKEAIYEVYNPGQEVNFPINFFPGWKTEYDGYILNTYPNKDGLLSVNLIAKKVKIRLFFENTPIRTLGNTISFFSFMLVFALIWKFRNYEKQN